jgi:hypothetical protein
MDGDKMVHLMTNTTPTSLKTAVISGCMNSQEKTCHHLPLTLKEPELKEALKILVKATWMRVYTLSPVKTPTFSHFQEEEEILLMLVKDQEKKLTHSTRELTITISTITQKMLVKETLMKKFKVLPLLILMYSQFKREE